MCILCRPIFLCVCVSLCWKVFCWFLWLDVVITEYRPCCDERVCLCVCLSAIIFGTTRPDVRSSNIFYPFWPGPPLGLWWYVAYFQLHFVRLATTQLKDEQIAGDNRVLACNFDKCSPIVIFLTGRLSNKPFLTWLLTTPPHLKYMYVAALPCNLSLIAFRHYCFTR